VCGDPLRAAPAPIWRDDVNSVARVVQDAVEISSGPMGRNRSGTRRQDGGKQMSFPWEKAVSNGIDALLNAVEASSVSSLSRQVPVEIRQLP
jgi:hypothetical protein